ncbi:hypothetical protein ACS0TY_024973 [Phlomoides rotata]
MNNNLITSWMITKVVRGVPYIGPIKKFLHTFRRRPPLDRLNAVEARATAASSSPGRQSPPLRRTRRVSPSMEKGKSMRREHQHTRGNPKDKEIPKKHDRRVERDHSSSSETGKEAIHDRDDSSDDVEATFPIATCTEDYTTSTIRIEGSE